MAYPSVNGPYGLRPVNLIGGQVFAGSTRELPIGYGYATAIGNGDIVSLARGLITKNTSTTSSSGGGVIGVFLGCSFTSPTLKQNTLASNGQLLRRQAMRWRMFAMTRTRSLKWSYVQQQLLLLRPMRR
jgi:hypothetical protein